MDIVSTSYYTCSLGNRELISYLVICFWKILSDFLIKSFMNAQMTDVTVVGQVNSKMYLSKFKG